MNRRLFLGSGGSALVVAGAGGLLATAGFKSCGETPGQLSRWTVNVISALTESRQVFSAEGLANVVAIIDKALEIARELKKAFDAGKNADALTYLALLLAPDGVLQTIALAVGLLQSEAQKRIVATVLVVARLALNLIAANIVTALKASGQYEARVRQSVESGKGYETGLVVGTSDGTLIKKTFAVVYGIEL